LRIFGQSVRTDIDSNTAILSLLRLVAESADKPIQEVQFPAQDAADGSGNVVIGDRTLRHTVQSFLAARATKGPRGVAKSTTAKRSRRKRKRQPIAVAGLIRNRNASEDIAAPLQVKLERLPVYYPTLMSATGSYRVGDSRAYNIVDRTGKRHRAYRIVAYEGRIGQYYGIQGTDWRSPPILDDPSASVTSGGRQYKLYYDGGRLKLVAWRTRRGSYWVSNTLLRTLTNKQMLALARSARSLGGR
jgi:polyisoprenyl-teichoic acid--peptidoglycan teichoic acid transferase